MTMLFSTQAKRDIRKFLTPGFRRVRRSLQFLYSRDMQRARESLLLLYPLYHWCDKKTGKRLSGQFPIPHGLARYEWDYLQGEFEDWDWFSVSKKPGFKLPPRDPPFPVSTLPYADSPWDGFPIVRTKMGTVMSTLSCRRLIPRWSWLFYMNQLPIRSWSWVAVELLEQHHRLELLSYMRLDRSLVLELKSAPSSGRLAKEFTWLNNLDPTKIGISLREYKDALMTVETVAYNGEPFSIGEYLTSVTRTWNLLEGPPGMYPGDVDRYLGPLVRRIYETTARMLDAYIDNFDRKLMDMEPLPAWYRYDGKDRRYIDGISTRIVKAELFRFVADCVWYGFNWGNFKGFERPEWQWKSWRLRPRSGGRTNLLKDGNAGRHKVGRRMAQLARRTRNR